MDSREGLTNVGDPAGGFEASIDTRVRRLNVRLWGTWTKAIVLEFISTVDRLGTVLSSTPWTSLVDATKFGVQDPLIEPHRQESLKVAARLGCRRMATMVASSVYALQFKRLASQGHVVSKTFPDKASAIAWLVEDAEPTRLPKR